MAKHEHTHEHHHDHDHDHDHGHDHPHDHDHDHAEEQFPAQISIEDSGPARKKLKIEVPAERVAAKLQENFESLRQEAAIPGFRRGRAPMRLLEKRFGSDVRNEVRNQLIGESYSRAVEDHNLRVIGEPDIPDVSELTLSEDQPLSFEVEVEVVPEFELPDLAGIEVSKPQFQVADEQVNAEIDRYREMQGQFKPAEGAAQGGDYLTADVRVLGESGEVLEERPATTVLVPGESRNFRGVVAGILVDDLGKQLEGKTAGETLSVQTTGPEQHENEKLRGQPLNIEIAIQRVERLEPAPVAELLKAVGLESEQELRDQIRQNLEQRSEAEQRAAMRRQVADALLEKVDLELPERLSARQSGRVLQRRAMEMMYRGVSQEEIEQQLAELRAASQADAQRELKLTFILDKIASDLDVEVSEAEVNGQIAQMAMRSGRRPERQREEMARSGQLEQLYMQLREQKAIDSLLEKVKVTEVSAEDWQKAEEARAQQQAAEQEKAAKPKAKIKSKAKSKAKAEKAEAEEPAEEKGESEGEASE